MLLSELVSSKRGHFVIYLQPRRARDVARRGWQQQIAAGLIEKSALLRFAVKVSVSIKHNLYFKSLTQHLTPWRRHQEQWGRGREKSREIAQTINLLRFHLKCRQIAGIFDIKAGQRQSQNAVQIIEKSEGKGCAGEVLL